jgi:hypothetical protein
MPRVELQDETGKKFEIEIPEGMDIEQAVDDAMSDFKTQSGQGFSSAPAPSSDNVPLKAKEQWTGTERVIPLKNEGNPEDVVREALSKVKTDEGEYAVPGDYKSLEQQYPELASKIKPDYAGFMKAVGALGNVTTMPASLTTKLVSNIAKGKSGGYGDIVRGEKSFGEVVQGETGLPEWTSTAIDIAPLALALPTAGLKMGTKVASKFIPKIADNSKAIQSGINKAYDFASNIDPGVAATNLSKAFMKTGKYQGLSDKGKIAYEVAENILNPAAPLERIVSKKLEETGKNLYGKSIQEPLKEQRMEAMQRQYRTDTSKALQDNKNLYDSGQISRKEFEKTNDDIMRSLTGYDKYMDVKPGSIDINDMLWKKDFTGGNNEMIASLADDSFARGVENKDILKKVDDLTEDVTKGYLTQDTIDFLKQNTSSPENFNRAVDKIINKKGYGQFIVNESKVPATMGSNKNLVEITRNEPLRYNLKEIYSGNKNVPAINMTANRLPDLIKTKDVKIPGKLKKETINFGELTPEEQLSIIKGEYDIDKMSPEEIGSLLLSNRDVKVSREIPRGTKKVEYTEKNPLMSIDSVAKNVAIDTGSPIDKEAIIKLAYSKVIENPRLAEEVRRLTGLTPSDFNVPTVPVGKLKSRNAIDMQEMEFDPMANQRFTLSDIEERKGDIQKSAVDYITGTRPDLKAGEAKYLSDVKKIEARGLKDFVEKEVKKNVSPKDYEKFMKNKEVQSTILDFLERAIKTKSKDQIDKSLAFMLAAPFTQMRSPTVPAIHFAKDLTDKYSRVVGKQLGDTNKFTNKVIRNSIQSLPRLIEQGIGEKGREAPENAWRELLRKASQPKSE